MADTQIDVLYESARTRIVRLPAGGLIRKQLRGADAAGRCRQERQILQRLAGVAGVPRLAPDPAGDADLLLYDEGSESLARRIQAGPLPVGVAAAIGVRLLQIIAEVHTAGVVHKDINPANVMLDGDRPVLIDFELAITAAEERPGFTHQNQIVGTLAYLAPEQTGRTSRAIDRRCDLYSFGATLYEMLTGRPPFTSTDPLQLLHDHLARRPAPVTTLNPDIPPALAKIIDRLLEKDPDRRYQSAEGCAYDLARIGDDQLELGTRDFPARLVAPSRLIGREPEIAQLRASFDDCLAGRARGLMISGPSGVGKTVLINELRQIVTTAGGWFVTGKFDQFRQDSGSDAVAGAYRALVRLLLGESDADLTRLRTALVPALGTNAGLLATLIPELGTLLQIDAEPPQGDQAEVQGRLVQALLALTRLVVTPSRPVVIVVDDLQWAAAASIALLEALLADDRMPGLLIVGAYRAEEVDAAHPLSAVLSRWRRLDHPPVELGLRNLPPDDISTLLAATLRMPAARAAVLAAAISPRTGGNPFESLELINGLRMDGVIRPSDDGWVWDTQAVTTWVGDRDIGDLLIARLDRLPRPARRLLAVMAALGGEAGLGLLETALAVSADRTAADLAPALADGLVVLEDGHDVRFRHDRIQQAAYALIPPRAQRLVHLILAERLAGRPECAGLAAQQYLPATGLITDPDRRHHVAELFRATAAGLRLLSYAAAEKYLDAAVRLAADGDPRLLNRVLIDHHRALYTIGRHGQADTLYADLAGRLDPVTLAEATGVQIESLTVRGRAADALTLGLHLLSRLGIAVPGRDELTREIGPRLDHLRLWAQGLVAADDLDRRDATDPATVAACDVIARLMPPAFFGDQAALVWLVTTAQRIWTEHGPAAALVVPLAHAGITGVLLHDDYRTGYLVLRHVTAVGDARGWEAQTAVVRFLASVSTTHWSEPVEHSIEEARQAHERLVHSGDLAFACFTSHTTVPALLDCAPTLSAFHVELTRAGNYTDKVGNEQNAAIMAAFGALHDAVTGEQTGDHAAVAPSAANPMAAAYWHTTRALAALFFGDRATLVAEAAGIGGHLPFIAGNYFTATARLVQALALLAEHRFDEADAIREWMTARAADSPANFRHLALFLDAERAWAAGGTAGPALDAALLFDAALREVTRRRRPWQHALIAERAARFHLDTGMPYVGEQLLLDAQQRWHNWGAAAKAKAQEREFPFLQVRRTAALAASIGASTSFASEAIDLMAVVKASRALSSETSLDRLRARVVKILTTLTGATRVHLLVRDEGETTWTDGLAAVTAAQVPLTIVRYAERTREPLVIDDAADDPRFAQDPYLGGLDLCAVLAMSVASQGETRAMLVLENHLWRGTFTEDRIDAVRIIAGQLVVSMENAALYASLERKVAERTEQLRLVNAQLEILSATDPLTGIANRRRLDIELEQAWHDAAARNTPLAVAMIDIDHFKLYNDRLGHATGDECLRLVAQTIVGVIRDADLVARYGGEEFTVVLPATRPERAVEMAERIQQAVQSLGRPHPAAEHGVVTVSIGVACATPTPDRLVGDLIAEADANLYEAKRHGRNRVMAGRPTVKA